MKSIVYYCIKNYLNICKTKQNEYTEFLNLAK